MDIPSGDFEVILADPPWQYGAKIEPPDRVAERYYNTMTLSDIKALKVPSAKNSILFLWVTAPMIKEGLEVCEAWGFTYKTHYVWDKVLMGIGHWARGQHELLYVAVKGKWPTPPDKILKGTVIRSKRNRHSQKPTEVYELVESYYPGKSCLELFARERRQGWTSWGNQLENNVQMLLDKVEA